MKSRDFQEEIKELNMTFLLLAQQMLRDDREIAMARLGISDELADFISDLSAAKIIKVASAKLLLPAFRFDNAFLTHLLSGDSRDPVSAKIHAAILAAGQSPEGFSGENCHEK